MDINKALQLFSLDDISNESKETLKKKYRKLMIKYHPDNCNGDDNKAKDISSAYKVLLDMLEKVTKYNLINHKTEVLNIVIPLSKLIDLYNGGKIVVGSADGQLELDKRTFKKHNALLIIEANIEYEGMNYNFNTVQVWNVGDNYDIHCDIFVKELGKPEQLKIKVEDKVKDFSMTSQSLKLVFTLTYNITVNVIINKKIKSEDKESDLT